MSKTPMVCEPERPPAELADDIQISCLGRESQRERCQRCFAVESSASKACASQKVGDRFQTVI